MPRNKRDPVRTDDATYIELDQTKHDWPYVSVIDWPEAKEVSIYIDCNPSAQIGEGRGLAALRLKHKRARKLRDFLNGLDLGDDDIE